MPNLTIESPDPNATVSMYFFTVQGIANVAAQPNPAPLEQVEPDLPGETRVDPPYMRIQCELFAANAANPTATIESCPFIDDPVTETLTWYAAFFPLQVMTGASLTATLYLGGTVVSTTTINIDVADILPFTT